MRNFCLSIISEFFLLSSSVCREPTVYTNFLTWPDFFYFWDSLFGQVYNTALCLKKISQKWMACVFDNTNLHKISQNVCLINTHIILCIYMADVSASYRMSFDDHSCVKCCIFIKLSQIMCPIIIYILIYQHAKCYCRFWKALWLNALFGNFHILLHAWNVSKLLQIVY